MFEITTEIARPPREVFAHLAQIEHAPLWYSAVKAVDRLDEGPVGPGTRARFTRQLGGMTVENDVEVSEFEADRTFAMASVSGPTPFSYRYRLEASGQGTRLRLEGEISGEGLSGPIAMFRPLAETFFKRGMAANLQTFKRLVENS